MERPVFKPDFYRELALENPLGLELHWREVEAWFNFIAWPAYKTYNYRRHAQTVRRWWARVRMDDLVRAREAMENTKIGRAQEEQDRMDAEVDQMFTDSTPKNKNALRKILGGGGGRAGQSE